MAEEPIRREEYERALGEAEALRRVVEEISSELELRPLLTCIVTHACELLRADDGAIGLFDPARNAVRMEATYRMPARELGSEIPAGVGLAGAVLASGGPVIVSRYGDLPNPTLAELADNAVIGVPIQGRTGLLGFFGIGARPPRRFGTRDLRTLQLFARHAAIAIENAMQYRRERIRSERMSLIVKVSRLATAGIAPAELAAIAAQIIHEQLGYPNVVIPLLEGEELVFRAHAGAYRDVFEEEYRMPITIGLTGAAARTRTVQLANDVRTDPRYVAPPKPVDVTSELAVPIVLGQEVFGVVNVEGREPFAEEDVASIRVIADHLAVAIQNARLFDEARHAAAMRERQRLARELHDSVSQVLSSISLISQSLVAAWRKDPQEGERRAHRLEELSRLAFAEMRALLRELRPVEEEEAPEPNGAFVDSKSEVSRHGLERALERLVAVLAPETLDVQLDFGAYRPQSRACEEGLFRICQEALSNAFRHSGARRLTVRAAVQDGRVRVEIADDGCGFDVSAALAGSMSSCRLGMQTMRERAAGLGGSATIVSAPGRGARVIVEVPRQDRRGER